MRAFRADLLALFAFAAGLLVAAVTGMAQEEIRSRLSCIPRFLIRLAALRPPRALRDRLGAEWDGQVDEWLAEVAGILQAHENVPVTGLVKALWFAVGIVACSTAVARALSGTPSRTKARLSAFLTSFRKNAVEFLKRLGSPARPGQVVLGGHEAGVAVVRVSMAFTLTLSIALGATTVTVMDRIEAAQTPSSGRGVSAQPDFYMSCTAYRDNPATWTVVGDSNVPCSGLAAYSYVSAGPSDVHFATWLPAGSGGFTARTGDYTVKAWIPSHFAGALAQFQMQYCGQSDWHPFGVINQEKSSGWITVSGKPPIKQSMRVCGIRERNIGPGTWDLAAGPLEILSI